MINSAAGEEVEEEGAADDGGDNADGDLLGVEQGAGNDVGEDDEAGAAEDGDEEQAAVIDAEDEAHGVGNDEADEADDAGHGDGGGGDERGGGEDDQLGAGDADAELGSLFVVELEDVEDAGVQRDAEAPHDQVGQRGEDAGASWRC